MKENTNIEEEVKVVSNNSVEVAGVIKKNSIGLHHEIYGEKFYGGIISVERISGALDELSFLISDKLCSNLLDLEGKAVSIIGKYRSYNKKVDESNHRKLELNIFVDEITMIDEDTDIGKSSNNTINLTGYICKEPNYRTTPLGRDICDLLLAVNRAYNKTDYIPCIAWGRNAKFASHFNVGDKIKLAGRIQSRTYTKDEEERVVYEVSISSLSKEDKSEEEK